MREREREREREKERERERSTYNYITVECITSDIHASSCNA